MKMYCNDEILSSIVNDGMKEFYAFLKEDLTRTKNTKSTKGDFLHLRCSYAHKKHKTLNKQLLLLRRFYVHKNAVFFIFIRVFCAFCGKQTLVLLLDVFYAHLKLSLILFAYVRFVLFVCVRSSRKKV